MVLSRAPHLVNDKNDLGETPFHHALKLDRCSIIEQLLVAGADAHPPDNDGNNALFYLSSKVASGSDKARNLLKRFLDLGISINSRNKLGETPLFWFIKACPSGKKSNFYINVDEDVDEEETYKTLLPWYTNVGASISDCDGTGQTLLHVVAAKQYNENFNAIDGDQGGRTLALFKHLMDLGLDPMAEDAQQRTSLDVAAACGNERVLKLFEKNGR